MPKTIPALPIAHPPPGVSTGARAWKPMKEMNPYTLRKPLEHNMKTPEGRIIRGVPKTKPEPSLIWENARKKLDLSQCNIVKYSWNPMAQHNEYGRYQTTFKWGSK